MNIAKQSNNNNVERIKEYTKWVVLCKKLLKNTSENSDIYIKNNMFFFHTF